ncbi:MAG: hypothetical protein KH282_02710 [Clostridiales bacterium]|nr:hypothetical protein [Clostridiales bacterium]
MAKPLTKKAKSLIAVIAVLAAAAVIAVGANAVYVFSARQKVSGYIRSITLVEDPQQEDGFDQYLGTTIGYWHSELSDAQKDMTYNTDQFNVYKIEAQFENGSGMKAFIQLQDICREEEYMLLITDVASYCNIDSQSSAGWTYYAFISKDYTLQDIENYLAENGAAYSAMFQRERSGGTFDLHAAYAPPEGTNA